MEFSIGTQFSREFTFQEISVIIETLNGDFKDFFGGRNYGPGVVKIYVGIICVSKGFEPFLMVRPLKILRKEPRSRGFIIRANKERANYNPKKL